MAARVLTNTPRSWIRYTAQERSVWQSKECTCMISLLISVRWHACLACVCVCVWCGFVLRHAWTLVLEALSRGMLHLCVSVEWIVSLVHGPWIRDAREWLFTFPLPPILLQSIPIPSHSHSQFCNQFPFPWDSHKAFPIPSHSHSRTLHRCSINYFGLGTTQA